MKLRDLFEQGRQQEIDRAARVHKVRRVARGQKQRSLFSPDNLIIGVGVLYQIAIPILTPVITALKGIGKVFIPTFKVVRSDAHAIVKKLQDGKDPDWEKYKNFCELARGKK